MLVKLTPIASFWGEVEEDVIQIKEGKTSWNRCRTPAKEANEETGWLGSIK